MNLEKLKEIREKYSTIQVDNDLLKQEIKEILEYLQQVISDLEDGIRDN